MARLTLVVTDDSEGYYLTDGTDESDAADWVEPVEFQGSRYLGEVSDDGEVVTLSKLTALQDFDVESDGEPEDNEESEDEVSA